MKQTRSKQTKAAYVAGTFDTKAAELNYIADCLKEAGVVVRRVDLSTTDTPNNTEVSARTVAACHPDGVDAVFVEDRGTSVGRMAVAFTSFLSQQKDLGGVIGAGGSGGTALISPALRNLPLGVPKVLISTVASGNTRPYVGPTDICMLYSVTDVQGLNHISRQVLANGAHALAGMIVNEHEPDAEARPAIGLTMFGLTTPCVQAVTKVLEKKYDCLVFHATGVGGQSMEKLADDRRVCAVLDLTTTEIADQLMGGIFPSGETRLDAIIRTKIPYLGSVGALDMVNFGAKDTVPSRYAGRKLQVHNPQTTLMRTTAEENRKMGAWLLEKLNRMEGPVRFLLPLGGVSGIDVPGKPFYDPEASGALFDTIRKGFHPAANRKLIEVDAAINDPKFAEAVLKAFGEML